jgi:hypothetical protein
MFMPSGARRAWRSRATASMAGAISGSDGAPVPGVDVEERDRVLVGVDLARRELAGDDPAEDAVLLARRCRLQVGQRGLAVALLLAGLLRLGGRHAVRVSLVGAARGDTDRRTG